MILGPSASLEKRKISDFEEKLIGGLAPEELATVYLGGYEEGAQNKNVRVKLNDIIAQGSGKEVEGHVLSGLKQDATLEVDGYERKTGEKGAFVWVFDASKLGSYIQVEHLTEEDYAHETDEEGAPCCIFNVCFVNTTLGSMVKLYLPNFVLYQDDDPTPFGKDTRFGLDLWQKDPSSHEPASMNPFDIEGASPYRAFLSARVTSG